jgi:hypothetical protein
MDKLTINSNFKFDVMKDFLVPNKYDFYIVFSRDYSRNKRGDVKPRDTLNSIFKKSTPEIKLMYIKKIEDAEIFGAVRKNKSPKPTNNYTSTTYLTFRSDSSFTLKVNNNTKNWDGTLYYSTDLETWSEWDGTTTLNSVNNKLYLRGKGNTVITGSDNQINYRWVLTGSNIECTGNIENLLDWETVESGSHPSMGPYCYAYLFRSGIGQPDSNPFTAEGVNARIFAQIKPATQFMTKYDPDNVAPDSIPKLQLMIEL